MFLSESPVEDQPDAGDNDGDGDGEPPFMPAVDDLCVPIPVPASPTATIGPGDALANLIEAAGPGDVFVLEEGTYTIAEPIDVNADGVTVIGVDRDAVIIDVGGAFPAFEVKESGFTIGNLTISGGTTSIRFEPSGTADATGGTVRYTVLRRPSSRHIEIGDENGGAAVGGEIICNKLLHDPDQCASTSNSSRAVLGSPAPGWRLSVNEVHDAHCVDRPVFAFVLRGGDGAIVDSNMFINGDAAISLGPSSGQTDPCSNGGEINDVVVCNNLVHHARSSNDGSIELRGACDVAVVHNAIFAGGDAPSIELGDESSGWVANNASNAAGDLDGGFFDPDLLQTNVLAPGLQFKAPGQLDLRLVAGGGPTADLSPAAALLASVCGADFLGVARDLRNPAAIGAFEQPAP